MEISKIFNLGYSGGWDDYDDHCYRGCGHHNGYHRKRYDDDDDGLLGIDIDLDL